MKFYSSGRWQWRERKQGEGRTQGSGGTPRTVLPAPNVSPSHLFSLHCHLLPVSVDLTPLGTSWEWHQTVFVLLCLASLTELSPQGPSTLEQVSEPPSFVRLNNIPVCGWTTLCLSIIRRWTLGSCSPLGCCSCAHEHGCANISLNPRFPFF